MRRGSLNLEKRCDFCLRQAKAVHQLDGYNLTACRDCWVEAADGWDDQHQLTLFEALQKNSLLIPDRNEQGLLPREYQPPLDFNI